MHEPNSSRSVSPYADGGASFFGLVAVDRDGWVVWYFNASNTGLHPPHVVGFSAFAGSGGGAARGAHVSDAHAAQGGQATIGARVHEHCVMIESKPPVAVTIDARARVTSSVVAHGETGHECRAAPSGRAALLTTRRRVSLKGTGLRAGGELIDAVYDEAILRWVLHETLPSLGDDNATASADEAALGESDESGESGDIGGDVARAADQARRTNTTQGVGGVEQLFRVSDYFPYMIMLNASGNGTQGLLDDAGVLLQWDGSKGRDESDPVLWLYHVSAVSVADDGTGALVVTMRNLNTVFALDRLNGLVLRWAVSTTLPSDFELVIGTEDAHDGSGSALGASGASSGGLNTAPSAPTTRARFYQPHDAMLYGNDTLVLMDTGLMRPGCAFADMGDDDKGHDRGHCFSRAVAYHLDASARPRPTATLIWEFSWPIDAGTGDRVYEDDGRTIADDADASAVATSTADDVSWNGDDIIEAADIAALARDDIFIVDGGSAVRIDGGGSASYIVGFTATDKYPWANSTYVFEVRPRTGSDAGGRVSVLAQIVLPASVWPDEATSGAYRALPIGTLNGERSAL